MITCIDCGCDIKVSDIDSVSICLSCVERRAQELTPEKARAMARIGWDAVIDEATGYQQVRKKGELKSRYEQYLKEETGRLNDK